MGQRWSANCFNFFCWRFRRFHENNLTSNVQESLVNSLLGKGHGLVSPVYAPSFYSSSSQQQFSVESLQQLLSLKTNGNVGPASTVSTVLLVVADRFIFNKINWFSYRFIHFPIASDNWHLIKIPFETAKRQNGPVSQPFRFIIYYFSEIAANSWQSLTFKGRLMKPHHQ